MKTLTVMAWLCVGAIMVQAEDDQAKRAVTFRVAVQEKLADGEFVYVAGDDMALGQWSADGFALSPGPGNVWTGTVLLPADREVQFKITRGSWDAERVLADGSVPGNEVVSAGGDATAELAVARWKTVATPRPPKITGSYRVHESVASTYLAKPRDVIVWLPPSYDTDSERRYPVLYMHDGQQVFDPQTSTHGQDWEVDEWCTRLIGEGKIEEIIVVGVYCTDDRYDEYTPSLQGTNYARFLIEELKPMIDREYRTRPGRESTAVAGASMGGKISFHLAWAHPDVYFGAACLSSAFAYREDRTELDAVAAVTAAPDLRLYLYCGAADELERKLLPGMHEMTGLLRERGFKEGGNLLVAEDPAALHNEAAWMKVTGQWLEFLFGKK